MAVDGGTWKAWESGKVTLFRRHCEEIARLINLPLASAHQEMALRWRRSHAD